MFARILIAIGLDIGVVRDSLIPIAVAIDMYYRLEFFELHTVWGHDLMAGFFGLG